jgi:hypothetical protein
MTRKITHITCNSGRVPRRLGLSTGGDRHQAWHRALRDDFWLRVLVSLGERAGGEQCPQCGESDLRPYGNGSKWACPRCYFVVPCCEGGELAAQPRVNLGGGAPLADPGRPYCGANDGRCRAIPSHG